MEHFLVYTPRIVTHTLHSVHVRESLYIYAYKLTCTRAHAHTRHAPKSIFVCACSLDRYIHCNIFTDLSKASCAYITLTNLSSSSGLEYSNKVSYELKEYVTIGRRGYAGVFMLQTITSKNAAEVEIHTLLSLLI